MSDGVVLLCSTASAAQHSSPRLSARLSVACYCSSSEPLDYGNGTLVGLPSHPICCLQSVQNAAARLIFRLCRSDHIRDALICLHWLRVPERIVFKLQCRLTGHCTMMPLSTYVSSHQSPTSRLDKDFGLPLRTICVFLLSDW